DEPTASGRRDGRYRSRRRAEHAGPAESGATERRPGARPLRRRPRQHRRSGRGPESSRRRRVSGCRSACGRVACASGESSRPGQPRLVRGAAARLGSPVAMWLIRAALRRPITVLVAISAVALTAGFAVTRMRADIFPDLDLPVIYVAQPYGGMSPAQMEGFITYYYEYHFLYINGIESVESKSIQSTSLLKLTFHPGTDMSEALSQTIGYVNRARAFMPPGTVGPFIMRFDAGTVPVGYLVFSSETRSLGEIQDLALNRVRPQFATLPGLTSPPPFGGSQRTIVIRVDPDRLRSYSMSPEDVIRAVTAGNVIMPSGSVNIGDETRISPMNS